MSRLCEFIPWSISCTCGCHFVCNIASELIVVLVVNYGISNTVVLKIPKFTTKPTRSCCKNIVPSASCNNHYDYKSMAWDKTVVTPLLMHWSSHRLMPSYPNLLHSVIVSPKWILCCTHYPWLPHYMCFVIHCIKYKAPLFAAFYQLFSASYEWNIRSQMSRNISVSDNFYSLYWNNLLV